MARPPRCAPAPASSASAPAATEPATPGAPTDRVFAALDARLLTGAAHPVALGLSGGGDSMALLDLAADWARRRGRRLLALTVDHGLNPDSARWTALAGQAARRAGADWQSLVWAGPKPATGLPAAARAARHALLADAARAAGARVILLGHTADDVAEEGWMRARGSTLGRLRPWAPSPAWPEGRGLMLLRPLLDARREALRDHLRARGLDWLEDPANTDPRFARTRARIFLHRAAGEGDREAVEGACGPRRASGTPPPSPSLRSEPPPPLREGAWTSAITFARAPVPDLATLSAALLCAAGTHAPPRGARLAALHHRLAGIAPFSATLAGARVLAAPDRVMIVREPGRAGLMPLDLIPGVPAVWDGRFEITAAKPGRIEAAAGRRSALNDSDRAVLAGLPAAIRPVLPVLICDASPRPVLAWRGAVVRCLAPGRLAAALGKIVDEAGLLNAMDGETPPPGLF